MDTMSGQTVADGDNLSKDGFNQRRQEEKTKLQIKRKKERERKKRKRSESIGTENKPGGTQAPSRGGVYIFRKYVPSVTPPSLIQCLFPCEELPHNI